MEEANNALAHERPPRDARLADAWAQLSGVLVIVALTLTFGFVIGDFLNQLYGDGLPRPFSGLFALCAATAAGIAYARNVSGLALMVAASGVFSIAAQLGYAGGHNVHGFVDYGCHAPALLCLSIAAAACERAWRERAFLRFLLGFASLPIWLGILFWWGKDLPTHTERNVDLVFISQIANAALLPTLFATLLWDVFTVRTYTR